MTIFGQAGDITGMDNQRDRKENRAALPLVLPFVLVYAALFIYPSLQMLATSFTDGALTKQGAWVGLANYERLLSDRGFGAALRNTLYFVALTVVPGTLVGLALAMVVNRLRGYWQAIALSVFFVPYILPVSTVTSIAYLLTDSPNSPLGGLAQAANGTTISVWSSAAWFMPSVAVLTIWWTVGFSVLLFLAGLRAIPKNLYEAAQLDGAGRWAQLRWITWTLLKPITILVLTIQLILQIRVFDQVYLMASQSPSRSATVLVHYIYSVAFQRNQAGYASAVAVALFLIVLAFVVLQFQLLRIRRSK
ncbi:MAG: sugar ABC transporter permease [Flavimaricola sp.]|nr:sugar ABC transporter permease [Flavimaricola sp.]